MVHPEYTLSLASERTRLSPQLIRAWEARHHAVAPRRTANGRRIYTDEDLLRLQHLRRLTSAGFPISTIAHLSTAELEELVAHQPSDFASRTSVASSGAGASTDAARFVAEAMEAIAQFDG